MSVWSAVNYQLRNEMIFGQDYSIDEMFTFYCIIMNRQRLCQLRVVKINAWRKRVNSWCEVEDGWLQKTGSGKMARYSKDEPECKLSKNYDKAQKLYSRGKELLKWRKR